MTGIILILLYATFGIVHSTYWSGELMNKLLSEMVVVLEAFQIKVYKFQNSNSGSILLQIYFYGIIKSINIISHDIPYILAIIDIFMNIICNKISLVYMSLQRLLIYKYKSLNLCDTNLHGTHSMQILRVCNMVFYYK